MDSVLLTVRGMSCGHCKAAVEKALKKVPGVLKAEADVAAGTVAVDFEPDKVSLDRLKEVINEEGYEAL